MKLTKLTVFEIKKRIAKLKLRIAIQKELIGIYYRNYKDGYSHAVIGTSTGVNTSYKDFAKMDFHYLQKLKNKVKKLECQKSQLASLENNEIAQMNIEKLKARYPNGFDIEHSLHRQGDF